MNSQTLHPEHLAYLRQNVPGEPMHNAETIIAQAPQRRKRFSINEAEGEHTQGRIRNE